MTHEHKALSHDIRYAELETAQDIVVTPRVDRKWTSPVLPAAGKKPPAIPRAWEALVDEINDPATGLVTRDFLRAELAQVREEIATLRGETTSAIAQLESRLTWRMITMLGVQIALVGIMVTVLVQVLR
jgi:hypothetical protein